MRQRTTLTLLAASLLGTSPAVIAATCSANSGPQRATLIELYTSEGCISCPPADRWLSGFSTAGQNRQGSQIVPLTFHVDYWDYIGWPDRFASPAFTARQQARRLATHGRFVYTPQTVINARDANDWRQAGSPGQLPLAPPVAASAALTLTAEQTAAGRSEVHLAAQLLPNAGGAGKPAVAYLALYENNLSSDIGRGENAGKQLHHDYVVRKWVGPLAFDAEGKLDIRHRFTIGEVKASQAGIAAVVESSDGAQLHQALALPLCP